MPAKLRHLVPHALMNVHLTLPSAPFLTASCQSGVVPGLPSGVGFGDPKIALMRDAVSFL